MFIVFETGTCDIHRFITDSLDVYIKEEEV